MDIIFLIGIFFLPFENFFFAPSAGWAAISPLIFVIYLIFNWKSTLNSIWKYRKLMLIFILAIIITLINFLSMDSYIEVAVSRTISTIISFGLGLVTLVSFDIYFIKKGNKIRKVEKIVLISYSIAFCIGILQFFAIKLNIVFIKDFFNMFMKRGYYILLNRVQYFFTEPSFIGMHIFGVLYPIYVIGKNKKIRNLMIIFCCGSILFGCGVRIILDTVVAIGIYCLYKIDFRKTKNMVALIVALSIVIIGGNYIYKNNPRVNQIINLGVYSDGSFASRWFRINASLAGYKKEPIHTLFGYGLGQEIIPLTNGYEKAYNEYKNSYMNEVNGLKSAWKTNEESTSFSIYTRVVSECGLMIGFLLFGFFIYVYKRIKAKKWKAVFLTILYLYIQFESYAFYAIWIFLVLNELENRRRKNENISIESSAVS